MSAHAGAAVIQLAVPLTVSAPIAHWRGGARVFTCVRVMDLAISLRGDYMGSFRSYISL